MSERDGAAKRERRLRSWAKHEWQDRRNGPGRSVAPLRTKETEGPECGQESLRTVGGGGRRGTSCTLPHGDRTSVSRVPSLATPLFWSGDGGVGRLHPRLPHTGCPGGEEEGRGGGGGRGGRRWSRRLMPCSPCLPGAALTKRTAESRCSPLSFVCWTRLLLPPPSLGGGRKRRVGKGRGAARFRSCSS